MTSLSKVMAEAAQPEKYLLPASPIQNGKFDEAKQKLDQLALDLFDTLDTAHSMKTTYEARLKSCHVIRKPSEKENNSSVFSRVFAAFSRALGRLSPLGNLGHRIFRKISSNLSFSSLFGKLDERSSYINKKLMPIANQIRVILKDKSIADITLRVSPKNEAYIESAQAIQTELSKFLNTTLPATLSYIRDVKQPFNKEVLDTVVTGLNCTLLEALVGLENEKSDSSNAQAQEIGNSHRRGFLETIPSEYNEEISFEASPLSDVVSNAESDSEFSNTLSSTSGNDGDSVSGKSHSASESGVDQT